MWAKPMYAVKPSRPQRPPKSAPADVLVAQPLGAVERVDDQRPVGVRLRPDRLDGGEQARPVGDLREVRVSGTRPLSMRVTRPVSPRIIRKIGLGAHGEAGLAGPFGSIDHPPAGQAAADGDDVGQPAAAR